MDNTFFTWENFIEHFGKEMVSAESVYNNMVNKGLVYNSMSQMDYHFISDKKEHLESLGDFLTLVYAYKNDDIKKIELELWELSGITNDIPITQDNLLFWALDMYKRGYEFDSILDGYGAPFDRQNPKLPNLENMMEDHYFDRGVEEYHKGNLSGAIINWNLVIYINPNEANSYYSRGIVKSELYTWKSALKDYDKAIEIAPDFVDANVNRGSLKDENGDFTGAIEDYNLALQCQELDNEHKQMIYFNRGNTRFNLNDRVNACIDWKKALELGAEYAKERIEQSCN